MNKTRFQIAVAMISIIVLNSPSASAVKTPPGSPRSAREPERPNNIINNNNEANTNDNTSRESAPNAFSTLARLCENSIGQHILTNLGSEDLPRLIAQSGIIPTNPRCLRLLLQQEQDRLLEIVKTDERNGTIRDYKIDEATLAQAKSIGLFIRKYLFARHNILTQVYADANEAEVVIRNEIREFFGTLFAGNLDRHDHLVIWAVTLVDAILKNHPESSWNLPNFMRRAIFDNLNEPIQRMVLAEAYVWRSQGQPMDLLPVLLPNELLLHDSQTRKGTLAFSTAIANGELSTIKLLFEGMRIGRDTLTRGLETAVRSGHLELVQFFLRYLRAREVADEMMTRLAPTWIEANVVLEPHQVEALIEALAIEAPFRQHVRSFVQRYNDGNLEERIRLIQLIRNTGAGETLVEVFARLAPILVETNVVDQLHQLESLIEALTIGARLRREVDDPVEDWRLERPLARARLALEDPRVNENVMEYALQDADLRNTRLLRLYLQHRRIGVDTLISTLERAAEGGFMDIVQILANDPRIQTRAVIEAFLIAAEHGRANVVQLLLQDERIGLREIQAAYNVATARGHLETAQMLNQARMRGIARVGTAPAMVVIAFLTWWAMM